MVSGTLLTGALFATASGAVFGYVGVRLGQREVDLASLLPRTAFAAWWLGLAAVTLLGAATTLAAAFGRLGTDLYVALTYYNIMVLAVALAALLYYLLHLYTGRTGWWKSLVVGYSAYLVFLLYFIHSHDPVGVHVGRWTVELEYAVPLEDDPLLLPVVFLLVGPQILASVAYLSLVRRVHERTLRYRIVTVATSLILWFGSALVGPLVGASDSDVPQVVSRAIGLAAALCILAAYYPPRILKRRYGLVSIREPVG